MKTSYILGGLATLALGFFGYKAATKPKPVSPSIQEALIEEAKALIGTLYLWGSKNPAKGGLDCSGFFTWLREKLGLLPKNFGANHNADSLYRMSTKISESEAVPGDAVFYGTQDHVSHVMMVASNGYVVGATGGGPSTTSAAIAKEQNAEVKFMPTHYRKDIVAFGRIPVIAA